MGGSYGKPVSVESRYFPEYKEKLPSLTGRTVAVTGCTSGTGFVAAKTCAELGATVLMLNRKSERADTALAEVKAAASQGAKVIAIECDLTDFESVRKAAREIAALVDDGLGLDVLVNNAGIGITADKPTKDGYGIQMQTNHLSHFLLTKELMPLLEKAAANRGEARVVNHTSATRSNFGKLLDAKHLGKNGGNLGGDDFGLFMDGPRWKRYSNSKLANVVFTLALHDRLQAKGSKVKALVAAPGFAATNILPTLAQESPNEHTGIFGLLAPLFPYMMQSAEDGTMPLLTCMLDPAAESGALYEPANMMGATGPPRRVEKLEAVCVDEPSRATLWAASEEAVGAFPV